MSPSKNPNPKLPLRPPDPQEPQAPEPKGSPIHVSPPGAPHRTVIGDDLLPALQVLGSVVDQHEIPAAALRAPHEVQEERSALQAGGALGREQRLGPGPVPVPVTMLTPPAPALTRSRPHPLRVLGAHTAAAHLAPPSPANVARTAPRGGAQWRGGARGAVCGRGLKNNGRGLNKRAWLVGPWGCLGQPGIFGGSLG